MVVVWLVVACHPALPALPSHDGPAWSEVKSQHFTLWTDAPLPRGRELVQKMERYRQVVMRVMNNAPSSATSFVIGLRDAQEVAAFLPKRFAAMAWRSSELIPQPGILVAVDADEDANHLLAHELTHVICFEIFPHLPAWLSEGIASFFEMVELAPETRDVHIGRPRTDHAASLLSAGPLPSATLFACSEGEECMNGAFYATSWAMVSFLINTHTRQFISYLRHLQQVPVDLQAALWNDEFPELQPDEIDPLLAQWLKYGHSATPVFRVTTLELPIFDRALGDGDPLAARSLLHFVVAHDPIAARVEVDAALARDRSNALAQRIDAALRGPRATEDELLPLH
jgi:hypothetical protein